MGGRFIRTEADKKRKERRKISVGGGGESLIWRGKREATTTFSVSAPPSFDKFFSVSALSFHGGAACCCLDCDHPMGRRGDPKRFELFE